ncbi:hypothetical protein HPO96_32535 [Kribbella sandramycini]|uniref:Glycosyltransferase involved in cell wall biosynthesis n=1 Tax=Kribbella sandramycini TaxID=60450 RepID=A0A7Y4P258_9ACTN|nr:glycosyltransferase [Kribbella sandramycini]MBB6565985.1 hypothetical protein [Kribbella sandramycini]NOL44987.1 hypothetical protein [Kribbella sandramycini]
MSHPDLRVVMLVADDVTGDSRVRREAAALAGSGVQVTVLGVSATGEPSKEVLDGALVVRVSVPYRLRDERLRRRAARRDWRPPLVGYKHQTTYVARGLRAKLGVGELQADAGHGKLSQVSQQVRSAGWFVFRAAKGLRNAVGRQADVPFRGGWRAYDGLVDRLTWPAPWQRIHPEALDLELAFGGLIDRLEPDVVHAQGVQVLGVATRAAGRAKLSKRSLQAVYDGREAPAGTPRAVQAWVKHERQYRDRVDRVVGPGEELRTVYAELTGRPIAVVERPEPSAQSRRLLIGPANIAGQAWMWSQAVERSLPGIAVETLATSDTKYAFPSHRRGTYEQYRSDLRWQFELTAYALSEVTHVLFERGRPMFGQLPGQSWLADVPTLDRSGIAHGLIFHGSEIRDPARHRELFEHSPFKDPADPLTAQLQAETDRTRAQLATYDGPVFVTTPDLLDFVPNSTWLPLTVDVAAFASSRPVLERAVPVVLHAPSSSALKGSAYVDPVLTALQERGLIEYQRVEGVPHTELAELVREADIVVDQLTLGSYGVFACESMAAGRVTVGHVADRVRAQLPTELPIAEATPDDLGAVIERLIAERETARKLADSGPAYIREVHDGRGAVEALLPFLGGR